MVHIGITGASVSRTRRVGRILDKMAFFFVTKALYLLFRKTVERLLSDKSNKEKLLSLVSEVAEGISTEGRIVISDLSTHAKRKAQVEILKNGFLRLNTIGPGSSSQTEEEEAMRLDEAEFQDSCNLNLVQRQDTVEVYDMIAPKPTPIIPPSYIITCRAILNFLKEENAAIDPEIWARRTAQHTLTKERISWEWVHPSTKVQGHLEFVDCARENLVDYTVVLKHQNDKDIPVPLAITKPHRRCCPESNDCGTVQKHLMALWKCKVYVAMRIRDNEGEEVTTQPFNTDQFGIRCNDLCAYVS